MVASACAPTIYGHCILFTRNRFDAPKVCIAKSKGTLLYQHFLCHCACEDCTKNLTISVIFFCIYVVDISKGKHLSGKVNFEWGLFCSMGSSFALDIKVLRSLFNETLWWMTSGDIDKLIEPNPSTATTIFIKDQLDRHFDFFVCVCLPVSSNSI